MKLKQYAQIELAAYVNRGEVTRLGVALIFIALITIITGTVFDEVPQSSLLVAEEELGATLPVYDLQNAPLSVAGRDAPEEVCTFRVG